LIKDNKENIAEESNSTYSIVKQLTFESQDSLISLKIINGGIAEQLLTSSRTKDNTNIDSYGIVKDDSIMLRGPATPSNRPNI
jgi:hypothetical protein